VPTFSRLGADDAPESWWIVHAHESPASGGAVGLVQLDEIPEVGSWRASELMALDERSAGLAKMDARKAEGIELRFFAG